MRTAEQARDGTQGSREVRSCQATDGFVYAFSGFLDFLHVQPSPRDPAVLDSEQGHSSHIERRFTGSAS